MRSYFVPRRGRCYYRKRLRHRRRVYKRTYRRRRYTASRVSRSLTAPRIHKFKTQVRWTFTKPNTDYDYFNWTPTVEQLNTDPAIDVEKLFIGIVFVPYP